MRLLLKYSKSIWEKDGMSAIRLSFLDLLNYSSVGAQHPYSIFQLCVWTCRGREGSPYHCLALTPPSPGGGFAQKVGFAAHLL
jgi:hypothetical protein